MKILLAIDGSTCSQAAVREVARRQLPAGSHVRVISVVEMRGPLTSEPRVLSADFFEEVERIEHNQARNTIERAARELREAGEKQQLRMTAEVLVGSPKRVIVEEAERWGADLIVVGSHSYRSWERMLLGSISLAVAMHAECSVEIVRERKVGRKHAGAE